MALVSNYNVEDIILKNPKKYSDYLICKVKYPESGDLVIQFPKMRIVETKHPKTMELEFLNGNSKYTRETYDFVSKVESFLMETIFKKSMDFFGKSIPESAIKKMYNNFIKAPKTSHSNCTASFSLSKNTQYINKKGSEINISEFTPDICKKVECLAQLKYVMFSKDTCFTIWEAKTLKLHKQVQRVPRYGFVEDPEDVVPEVESDDEEHLISTFF